MAIFENTTEEKKDENKPEARVVTAPAMRAVLVRPRISEKAARQNQDNKYVFEVTKKANKVAIKKAVEISYKVRVTKVNIINTDGKNRTFGKNAGRTSDFKKAIVTLKEGDKIE